MPRASSSSSRTPTTNTTLPSFPASLAAARRRGQGRRRVRLAVSGRPVAPCLYYWHYLGNQFLTTLSNCFTNLNLTDMETCYKVFRSEIIKEILPTLKQDRFGFEPEITAKIARRHVRIYERSISYSGRTYEQGKKIGWRDGFKALWCIIKFRPSRIRPKRSANDSAARPAGTFASIDSESISLPSA